MSCMADPGGEEKPTVTYSSISDTSSAHFVSQLQTFEPYNTAPGNEILGFSSKLVPTSSDQFYDQATNDTVMIFPDSNRLLAKSSSFPHSQGCHGLSLSLNSSDPAVWRFGHNNPHEQVSGMQLGHFQVRNSNYLGPAKELLAEFCSVGINQTDDNTAKGKAVKNSEWIDSDELVKKQSLYASSLLELHQRKTKLIQMLEEVQRRYKHYCSQMKALVQTFEAVAGNGAAEAYSGMASRAMSRHFRCLKDAIVAQIKATKREIGEKDNSGAAPGTTKGETPRLRILDQTLRQQRAYQHMNMMESHPWRPQRGLPERAVSVLRAWLFEHFLHPYPSDVDKTILARQTGLSRSQVSNWFINARVRLWKPMVEEMYLEDLKEKQQPTPTGALNRDAPDLHHDNHDQKPAHDPTIRIESGCLSSVVNNNSVVKSEGKEPNIKYHHPNGFNTVADAYGTVMQFDFSSYNNHHPTAAGNTSTALYGGGRGVSLTLGLHGGGGFSPASQSSLFLSREEMGECGTELYSSSLLDGENQGLVQYRNLMGAQFLHDLAG